MGKASRTKVDANRREKIAAQREAARRAEQRKRILLATGSIIVVAAIVLTFVIIKLNNKSSGTSAQGVSNGPTGTALASVVHNLTTVPASTLAAVGNGGGAVTAMPKSISGSPLTANGKPEMLFIGAEYCPYCGAERWAMIVALSRFGTFTGLSTVHSSTTDTDPDTPTWTFVHATYTSQYLTFTSVEETTNIPDPSTGSYTLLQTPTAAQQTLITKYAGSSGTIPFIDFGNKYMIEGASYDASLLGQGKISWATIASDLHNPNSSIAKGVLGVANYITAAICGMTGNQPASVCTPAIKSLESQI
jgi:Domain of unknown function (DUF929)